MPRCQVSRLEDTRGRGPGPFGDRDTNREATVYAVCLLGVAAVAGYVWLIPVVARWLT